MVTVAPFVHRGHADPASQAPLRGGVRRLSAETEAGLQPLGEIAQLHSSLLHWHAAASRSVTAPPAGQTEETHREPERLRAGAFPLRPPGDGERDVFELVVGV